MRSPAPTARASALRRLWRSSRFSSFVASRSLLAAFAYRDLRTRYRTSAIGWVWSLLQPLANLAVFAVVFSVVFRVPVPPLGRGETGSYVLYLFTGLVGWNLFSGLIHVSMTSLRESGALLRKVAFPAWTPVVGAQLVQLVQVGLELLVLLGWFLVVGNVGWQWLLAPVILVGFALFAGGVGLALSTANARFGDVQYIVTVVLGALYFLTPVLYPTSAIPASAEWLKGFVESQPVSLYVDALRDSLYSLDGPGVRHTAALLLAGMAVFAAGLWIFDRTTEDVGELL